MSTRTAGLGIDLPSPAHPRRTSAHMETGLHLGIIKTSGIYVPLDHAPPSSITLCASRPTSTIRGPRPRLSRGVEGFPPAGLGDAIPQGSARPGVNARPHVERGALASAGGVSARSTSRGARVQSFGSADAPPLQRHGTLMSAGASPARKAAELKSLLGNAHAKLKPGASVLPPGHAPLPRKKSDRWMRKNADSVILERAKSRARVEADLALSGDAFVQGQQLSGQVVFRIRKCGKKESPVLLSDAKVRIVGFECIPDEEHRYVFYQHARRLEEISYASEQIYGDGPEDSDGEGYRRGREGVHVLPFEMDLPVNTVGSNAKGDVDLHGGVAVRYIVMVSVKVKDADSSKHSLAHFYRSCSVWPQLSLQAVLAPAPRALVSTAAKSLFLGGRHPCNKLMLTARLPRLTYFAGQRCYMHIRIANDTSRAVRGITVVLVRTTTVYRPRSDFRAGNTADDQADSDAYQTSTIVKEVAESRLELGERAAKGHASAKGWWTGVDRNEETEFSHSILLPPDTLSIARSRLLAIDYTLRVTATASSGAPGFTSDLSAVLPIRIASMLSVDPPPSLSLPNEALTINRYCKAFEAPHFIVRTRDGDIGAGTLPPYRTQPPSLAGVIEEPGIPVLAEQPPYYTSHLENTAPMPGSSSRRDSDVKRHRPAMFAVVNPSLPSMTLSDDILESTRCHASPSGTDTHMGHPSPRISWRRSSQSVNEMESILMQDHFSRGAAAAGGDIGRNDGDDNLDEDLHFGASAFRNSPTSLRCARARALIFAQPSIVEYNAQNATKPQTSAAAGVSEFPSMSASRRRNGGRRGAMQISQVSASPVRRQVDIRRESGHSNGTVSLAERSKLDDNCGDRADRYGGTANRSLDIPAESSFARRVRDKLARSSCNTDAEGAESDGPSVPRAPPSVMINHVSPDGGSGFVSHTTAPSRSVNEPSSRRASILEDLHEPFLHSMATTVYARESHARPQFRGASPRFLRPAQARAKSQGASANLNANVRQEQVRHASHGAAAASAPPSPIVITPSSPSISSEGAPLRDASHTKYASPTLTTSPTSPASVYSRPASALGAPSHPPSRTPSPRVQMQMPARPKATRAPGSVMDRVMMLEQRVQEAEG